MYVSATKTQDMGNLPLDTGGLPEMASASSSSTLSCVRDRVCVHVRAFVCVVSSVTHTHARTCIHTRSRECVSACVRVVLRVMHLCVSIGLCLCV